MALVSLEWVGDVTQRRVIVSPQMPIDCILGNELPPPVRKTHSSPHLGPLSTVWVQYTFPEGERLIAQVHIVTHRNPPETLGRKMPAF